MRLQLKRALSVGILAVALGSPGLVSAVEVDAAQRFTLFREPSATSGNDGVTVIHGQTDVAATFASVFGVSGGYAVDSVSGATPSVFRVDTVSAATKFSDTRHQVRGALTYTRPTADVTAGVSYGWESDYKAGALNVTTRSDVLDHAFTLGLAYTHNWDRVCDQNNQETAGRPLDRLALVSSANCFKDSPEVATRRLHIDSLEPSITWAATPRLLIQGGATAQILDGFQSNPYRRVELGSAGRTPQESLPTTRQRFALFVRSAYAFPRSHTSLQLMGRLYRDTWAVEAMTGEMVINQYLAKFLLLTARGRMHAQRGAIFYRDASGYRLFGPNSQYWTGDRELSPMRNILVGGKLAYLRIPESPGRSFFDEIEVAVKWEGLFYQLDSASAPNADRKLALIWQGAVSLRF
ncbi:MAG: DUF3570 domain-containing protein [Bacteroidota bacterium]